MSPPSLPHPSPPPSSSPPPIFTSPPYLRRPSSSLSALIFATAYIHMSFHFASPVAMEVAGDGGRPWIGWKLLAGTLHTGGLELLAVGGLGREQQPPSGISLGDWAALFRGHTAHLTRGGVDKRRPKNCLFRYHQWWVTALARVSLFVRSN